MVKLFDDKKCVDIRIKKWDGNGYSPDCSENYYNVGSLEYDEEREAYRVNDVQYCIDILNDSDDGINPGCETEDEKIWEAFIDVVEEEE